MFAGGYAAGYYSYKWAEVLSADAFSLFEEQGVLSPAAGARFRDEVLARGGSRPALESFVAFRGRPPQLDALLRHNGMVDAALKGGLMVTLRESHRCSASPRCVVAAGALAQAPQVYRYVDAERPRRLFRPAAAARRRRTCRPSGWARTSSRPSEPSVAAQQARRALSGHAVHVRVRRRLPERRGAAQQARRAVHRSSTCRRTSRA